MMMMVMLVRRDDNANEDVIIRNLTVYNVGD